jgi:hypothetical protein
MRQTLSRLTNLDLPGLARTEENAKALTRALLRACRAGDARGVHVLLQQGAGVNETDPIERSFPLIEAMTARTSLDRRIAVAQLLLSAGANLHAQTQDANGFTVLHTMAGYADRAACAWLLDCGAGIHIEGANAWTPLHCAAAGNFDLQCNRAPVCQLLIERGANVQARAKGDAETHSVLDIALSASLNGVGSVDHAQQTLRVLLQAGSNDSNHGRTLARWLGSHFHLELAELAMTIGYEPALRERARRADARQLAGWLAARDARRAAQAALSHPPEPLQT